MTRRFRFETAVAFVIGGAIVAACTSAPDASESDTEAETTSSAPVTSTEPRSTTSSAASTSSTPAPPETAETPATTEEESGPAWVHAALTGPFADPGDLKGTIFSAGGMVWTLDGEPRNVLHGTADGENWVTLDLPAAGLSAGAGVQSLTGCGDAGLVVEDRGDEFTIVLTESHLDELPEYVFNRYWLVDIAGGEVTAMTSTKGSPLEALLKRDDGKMYRTLCVGGIATAGDTRYLTGIGDWFEPWATDGGEGFTAALKADGTWDCIVEPGTPFGDGWHREMDRLVAVGDMLVTMGQLSAGLEDKGGVDVWLSQDGRGWELVHVPLSEEGRIEYQLASGGAGLAVLGAEEVDRQHDRVIVAASTDGRTWTTTVLSEAGQARGVVVDGAGFRVFGLDGSIPDSVSTMWTSADGVTWDAEEIDLPTELIVDQYMPDVRIPVLALGEGLITMVNRELYVNGLDWPAAA